MSMACSLPMLTKSKKIGVTGPVEVGDAKTYIDGFVQGVTSVDPTINVSKTWTGSFSDVALMTEAAKTHIASRRRRADRLVAVGGRLDRRGEGCWQRVMVRHTARPVIASHPISSWPASYTTGRR